MLALRSHIHHAVSERTGFAKHLLDKAVFNAFVERMSPEKPIMVLHSSAVSPSTMIETLAREHNRPIRRMNISSRHSAAAALSEIQGSGFVQGDWISLDFPPSSAAANPPPVHPALAAALEDELNDQDAGNAMYSMCGVSRTSSMSSMASASSFVTSRIVDSYSGTTFTGEMILLLRKIGVLLATTPLRCRHEDFRLFVYAPIDFASSPLDLPTVVRLYATVVPLLTHSPSDDVLPKAISKLHVASPGRPPSRLQRALLSTRETLSPPRLLEGL